MEDKSSSIICDYFVHILKEEIFYLFWGKINQVLRVNYSTTRYLHVKFFFLRIQFKGYSWRNSLIDCKICRKLFIFRIFRLYELKLSNKLCIKRLIQAEPFNSSYNLICLSILELEVKVSFSSKVIRILLLVILILN